MSVRLTLAILSLTLLGLACSKHQPTQAEFSYVDLALQQGRSARVDATDITLTFDNLVSDSRCPVNAYCDDGGYATISLHVRDHDGALDLVLPIYSDAAIPDSTYRSLGPRNDLEVGLVALAPYPSDFDHAPERVYVASLRVRKVAPDAAP